MTRRITIALACLAAVALVVWCLRLRGDPVRPTSIDRATDQPPSADDSRRSGVELGAEVDPVARESLGSSPIETAPASANPAATNTQAVLLVRTVSAVDRRALARVRLTLFVNDAPLQTSSHSVASSRGSLTENPLTDAEGRAEFQVAPGIGLTLGILSVDPRTESGTRDVPALRPDERREMTVELATGNDLRFVGRVVRKSDGTPVPGAHIGAVSGDFLSSEDPALAETLSDTQGLFDFAFPSWRNPYLRVEAEGYGLALVTPTKDHDSPDRAFVVELSAGATLEARVLDADGRPLVGAIVRLTASQFELRNASENTLSNLVSIPDEVREGTTSSDGRCVLRDLSPGTRYSAEVLAEGVTVRRESEPIVLSPGQVLEREWRIGSGGSFLGVVIDQHDQAVAGLEIWLAQAPVDGTRFFQPHESESMVAKTTSDAQGRFAFHDVAPAAWWIGPGAGSLTQPSQSDIASQAARFEMTASESQEITLRVQRGIFIGGRVVDPAGVPVEALVWASDGGRSGVQAKCGENGGFSLGPLVPGHYTLIAFGRSKFAPSNPLEAESGQQGIELRLRPAGSLRGRVIDASTGKAVQAEMRLALEDSGPKSKEQGTSWTSHEDGTFEMEGLEPGLYGISAGTKDGGFGILRSVGVSVGAETGDLVVAVSPGGRLRLRYEGTRPRVQCIVRFQGVQIGWGLGLQPGGTSERFAPAGTLSLSLRTEDGKEISTRTVELDARETTQIVFRDGE